MWRQKMELIDYVKKNFEGKIDKAGNPYFDHCVYVATQSKKLGKELGLSSIDQDHLYEIGLLHDVMEDCGVISKDLLQIGVDPLVVNVVELLTHRQNQSYNDYLCQLEHNLYALIVKSVDAFHNSTIERYPNEQRTKETRKRCKRYLNRSGVLLEKAKNMLKYK